MWGVREKTTATVVLELEIAGRAVQVVFRIMGIDTEEICCLERQLPKTDGTDR